MHAKDDGDHGTERRGTENRGCIARCPYSKNAAIIGEVTEEQPGKVVMTDGDWNAGITSTAGRGITAADLLSMEDKEI